MILEVVFDANVLFRSLISGGEILKILFDGKLKLFAPLKLKEEFIKHEDEILSRSKLSKKEFNKLKFLLFKRITFVSLEEYKSFISKARKILIGHEKDEDFIALCLLKNIKFWTYEQRFFKNEYGISTKQISGLLREL